MDNENRFGMFLKKMRCKVTNEPKQFQWGTVVPCQIGFKDRKTEQWSNVWIDIIVTPNTQGGYVPAKGDLLTVSGRCDYKEYQGKPQWSAWADVVEGQNNSEPQREKFGEDGLDSVPF